VAIAQTVEVASSGDSKPMTSPACTAIGVMGVTRSAAGATIGSVTDSMLTATTRSFCDGLTTRRRNVPPLGFQARVLNEVRVPLDGTVYGVPLATPVCAQVWGPHRVVVSIT
jgi:hypothetical protein